MTTRLRTNFLSGSITDNPLLTAATVINSPAFANLPVVTAPDFLVLELDPARINGPAEIVYVTAHAAASTTVTVLRAQEGTAARDHANGERWTHGATTGDFWGGGQVWYGAQSVEGGLLLGDGSLDLPQTYSLEIQSSENTGAEGLLVTLYAALQTPGVKLVRGLAAGAPPTTGKTLGAFGAVGVLTGSTYGGGATVNTVADENFSATAGGASLIVYVTPKTTTTLVRRLHITGTGVGIGDIVPNAAYMLDVDGEARVGSVPGDRLIADDFQSRTRGGMLFRQPIAVNSSGVLGPAYGTGTIVVLSGAGTNSNDIIIQRPGALSATNVSFTISNRSTNDQVQFIGYDGTTFRTYLTFDYTNKLVTAAQMFSANGPSTGAGTTHEVSRVDGYAQMYTRGFAYSADNTPHQGGVTAGLSISALRNSPTPLASLNNIGTGDILQLYKGTTLVGSFGSDGSHKIIGVGGSVRLYMKATDSAADAKVWDFIPFGSTFLGRIVNDAESSTATWLTVTRSGMTVTETKFAGKLALSSPTTATTVGAAGGAAALPATPLGYLVVNIGGTDRKIPYYNT